VVGSTDPGGTGAVHAQGMEEWLIDGETWYRVWMVGNVNNSDTTVRMLCGLADGDLSHTYSGDGASSVYWWGAQLERVGSDTNARPSSYIPTTTSTVTRSVDQLSVPWPWSAGNAVQIYAKFRELRSPTWAAGTGRRIWQVGASNNANPRLILYRVPSTDDYKIWHDTGAPVSSEVTTASPSWGDTIEGLVRFDATGAVQLSVSKNSGAEIASATSAALTPAAWSDQVLHVGDIGTIAAGHMALIALIAVRPTHTLADFRDLLP